MFYKLKFFGTLQHKRSTAIFFQNQPLQMTSQDWHQSYLIYEELSDYRRFDNIRFAVPIFYLFVK
jgi:hypothetical protein